jgi:hypothetical protein
VPIIWRVKFKCFCAYSLILCLPWCYPCISYFSCTYWVPTVSVLNLAIFPCYSNLLLRRRRWIGILWRGVLRCVLPRLPFLWSYGVFRYFASLRVIVVFRDIIYVIILYSCHLVIYEHFWPYVWNNWSWVMHTMSTWFRNKNQIWELRGAITEVMMHNTSHKRIKHMKCSKSQTLLYFMFWIRI